MRSALLIPLGAGIAAAVLHLSVTLGSPGSFLLAYFAQAPIAATGLALGFMPAAVAAAFAAIIVALGAPGVGTLSLFVLTSALPVLLVVYFALQNRNDDQGNLIWYPAGRLLSWLTLLGIAAFGIAFLVFLQSDAGMHGTVEGYLRSLFVGVENVETARIDEFISTMARIFPAAATASWILMNIINCVMAQRFLAAANKNIRPNPSYREIDVPPWLLGIVIFGAILLFIGGEPGFFGLNIMLIGSVPFFFIGLAVLHSISAAWPGRPFLLVGVYLFLILAHWPAAIVVALGALEHWLRLRDRMNTQRPNKGNE